MKHLSMANPADKLIEMVERHTDTPWDEVIEFADDELDAARAEVWRASLDSNPEAAAEAHDRLEEAETGCYFSLEGQWYVVTWPEHVTTPRYNSDATYHGPMAKAEAVEWAYECWPD